MDGLIGRQQRIVINGAESDWDDVTSGVPQRSALKPLLFVIFINDIDSAVDLLHTTLWKFADDTKGARTISCLADSTGLQCDLNALADWASIWQMKFNEDKCKVIHLRKKIRTTLTL